MNIRRSLLLAGPIFAVTSVYSLTLAAEPRPYTDIPKDVIAAIAAAPIADQIQIGNNRAISDAVVRAKTIVFNSNCSLTLSASGTKFVAISADTFVFQDVAHPCMLIVSTPPAVDGLDGISGQAPGRAADGTPAHPDGGNGSARNSAVRRASDGKPGTSLPSLYVFVTSISSTATAPTLVIKAIGANGGRGGDGEQGATGQAGGKGVDDSGECHNEEHEGVHGTRIVKVCHCAYANGNGGNGGPGSNGGNGGAGESGGPGGEVWLVSKADTLVRIRSLFEIHTDGGRRGHGGRRGEPGPGGEPGGPGARGEACHADRVIGHHGDPADAGHVGPDGRADGPFGPIWEVTN